MGMLSVGAMLYVAAQCGCHSYGRRPVFVTNLEISALRDHPLRIVHTWL